MNPEHHFGHLVSWAIEQPWALTRPMLSVVAGILARHHAGQTTDRDLRTQVQSTPRRSAPAGPAAVAVIPIHGVIAPRMNLLSDVSGGTTYQSLRVALSLAVSDPQVATIVLDVDSPGGSVAGASECATALRAARERKPIIAVAEYQMCSAAYWIAANATEVVAAPSAQVGSIGVFTMHEDLSKMLDQLGVKVSIMSAGKYKVDASPVEPLSPEARARIQRSVDGAYGRFVADVAKGRGVLPASVRSGFGEGAVVDADEALRCGMVNSIATLEDTITRVLTTPPTLAPTTRRAPPVLTGATRQALDGYRQQLVQAMGDRRPTDRPTDRL